MAKSGEASYVESGGSGYVVTARPNVAFTSVKAYFTVPSITGCMGGAQELASLDGLHSPDFEQAGYTSTAVTGLRLRS